MFLFLAMRDLKPFKSTTPFQVVYKVQNTPTLDIPTMEQPELPICLTTKGE